MKNPIFADTTLFLDYDDTRKVKYVSGAETTVLSDGTKIMRLETRQPLVEIKTTGGFSFIMSPETAFSLHRDDEGQLWRFSPVDYHPGYAVDWYADLSELQERRYALAGKVVGNGLHINNRFRTSFTVVRTLDEAFELQSFLTRLGKHYVEQNLMHVNSLDVKCTDTHHGYLVGGRALTLLIGNLLAEKTLTPTFHPGMVDKGLFRAFVMGLLSTAAKEGEDLVVRHRDADAVRTLGEHLYFQFGIPCDISVNPMEPKVQMGVSASTRHMFRLSSDQQKHAALAGLIRGTGDGVNFFQRDLIETITPLKRKVPSVIVLPGSRKWPVPLTANGFAFRAQFEIPVGVAEIASHPALLKDSSDPALFEDMK